MKKIDDMIILRLSTSIIIIIFVLICSKYPYIIRRYSLFSMTKPNSIIQEHLMKKKRFKK